MSPIPVKRGRRRVLPGPSHPAKFSDELLPQIAEWLEGFDPVLDPMAGVGGLARIVPDAFLNELEPEWAEQARSLLTTRITVGDARHLPYASDTVGAIATSPTYGNRIADHHEATDSSRRNTYRHRLGRRLHPANTGQVQWGNEYRAMHLAIWTECYRVLRPGGRFILNVSNHIRESIEVDVTTWHLDALTGIGLALVAEPTKVATSRNRDGQHHELRCEYESLALFEKRAPRSGHPGGVRRR